MKKALSYAIAGLSAVMIVGAASAQDTMSPSTSPAAPAPAASAPAAPAAQAAPDAAAPAATAPAAAATPAPSDQSALAGQMIYSSKGTKIGTVAAVSTDAQGQQQAVVGVERFLGLGGKNILFPVSSLQPRTGGGFTTSLSSTEIKKLPEASASTH